MNCECCGKLVESRDNFALHTACMRNHAAHLIGERSSRCKSGVKRTSVEYQRLPDDFEGNFEALTGEFDAYFNEARSLHRIGIRRSGVFGTACPKCYRQMRYRSLGMSILDGREPWCHCADVTEAQTEEFALFGRRVTRKDSKEFRAV